MNGNDTISNVNQTPEQERSISELKSRVSAIDSRKIMDKNKLNKLRTEIITRLFETMKEMGVDPSNIESISSFMQKLEREDPDLFILFESAMGGILGDETPAPETAPVQPEVQATPGSEVQAAPVAGSGVGLMEKYKNLQQGTMRQ